jgi:hypothetical protein
MTNRVRLWITLFAVLAVLSSFSVVQAQTGNRGRSNFDWIVARRITITTLGLTVTGDTSLGDTDIIGTLTADNVAGGALSITPTDAISVTAAMVITPTASYHPLESAGAVGATLGVCDEGLVTTFVNTVNQTITITETATAKMAGNFAMGQFDTLTLVGDGTFCYELSRSNN